MKKDLPKFKISIDDIYSEDGQDLGIEKIAFTKTPAILVKGMAFSSQEPKRIFFADNLKYRIAAPVMIPMEIYRNDEDEYYVQFTAEEIEKIHSKFMANMGKEVFNLEHTQEIVPAYLLETILVDSEPKINMIKQEYGIDVPLGTSFCVAQVTNKEYYNELVANEQLGFSIEGFLGMALNLNINNENKNKQKMENENKLLPGEYPIGDDKILVVAEDGSMIVKEETKMAEASTDEVIKEDETKMAEASTDEVIKEDETKMAEDISTELPVAELPVTYTKEEVDAKFEELYKMIADLKTEEVVEDLGETEEVELSAHQRFQAVTGFLRSN
jgi:hypothetical protein